MDAQSVLDSEFATHVFSYLLGQADVTFSQVTELWVQLLYNVQM